MPASSQQPNQVFFALSDVTHRGVLARFAQGETTLGELASPFEISKPAIGKHIRILENAGLMDRTVTGRQHRCALTTAGLNTAQE